MRDFVEELLKQMTLHEKVSLLAGANSWEIGPIERLGIPALKVTDGPNGARGENFAGGNVTSACFPAGIALAATWNTALIEQVGKALGQEAQSKGAHVLLGPTANIHRSPVNGRNFESFSEDPYLSARMAVAYIKGLQSQGVGATVKHYICNDSEFERNSISSEVGERALREIYLPAFQAAIQEAGSWAIMSAYNKLNGTFCSENAYLLTEILRQEWGFDGVAMSDWFGTKSTAPSVNAGLDLEMPGPPIWRGEKLLQAAEHGQVEVTTIDKSVRRLLHLFVKAGVFEQPNKMPEQSLDLPEHRALIRQAGAEAAVLLKNTPQILPLQSETLTSLAIIGPNAKVARIMGGGSASLNPHYAITPFDGIVAQAGEQIKIGYELGCPNHKMLPLLDNKLLNTEDNKHGLQIEYFNNTDGTGASAHTELTKTSEIVWFGVLPAVVDRKQFFVRLSGNYTPEQTGEYAFSLISTGLSRLFVNGQQLVNNWTYQERGETYFGFGTTEVKATINLIVGQSYALTVEYGNNGNSMSAVRLGCLPPLPADRLERAAALAASSDVALVFVGTNGEWESEGADRPDIDLPGEQVALIEQVAAANKNTVVVLHTGSPMAMPWLDKVAAVVQAWYPGQECGNAIADVLFGVVTPSGKLPQTFPVRLEDNPAYINYPGENGRVHYGEGLFVGYRYYEKKRIEPLFPFGFGLSYTTFSYSNLQLSTQELEPHAQLQISLDVANTGERVGKEVVQLYIRDVKSRLHRPNKELKGFAKVQLEPGEQTTVIFTVAVDKLAYYDDRTHEWVAEAGEFEVLIGASSQDIRATATFSLSATHRFGQRPGKKRKTANMSSTIAQLLADEEALAILNIHIPDIINSPQISAATMLTLEQVASFVPDLLTEELLERIARELEA